MESVTDFRIMIVDLVKKKVEILQLADLRKSGTPASTVGRSHQNLITCFLKIINQLFSAA
jgi:hypothetical protein